MSNSKKLDTLLSLCTHINDQLFYIERRLRAVEKKLDIPVEEHERQVLRNLKKEAEIVVSIDDAEE